MKCWGIFIFRDMQVVHRDSEEINKGFQKPNERIPRRTTTTVSTVPDRPINKTCQWNAGFGNMKIVGNPGKIYFDRLMVTTAKLEVFKR